MKFIIIKNYWTELVCTLMLSMISVTVLFYGFTVLKVPS